MNADQWKRGLTRAYIAAWVLWAMVGLLAVLRYPGPTDGPTYPRIVGGILLACGVLPAFVLGVLRRAYDRFLSVPSSRTSE